MGNPVADSVWNCVDYVLYRVSACQYMVLGYIWGWTWKRERENIVIRGQSEVNEGEMWGLLSN